MKRLLTLLFPLPIGLCLTHAAAGSSVYRVSNFSPEYHATVTVTGNPKEVFVPGVVRVFDKSGKKLIEVKAEELSLNLKNGQVGSNVHDTPYGEQSVVIHEDFNFDGRKDLAIMDGQNSCYHGPSFQIYLGVAGGFRHNPSLTRLAQEYCGLFRVNPDQKLLETRAKSGCCWHQYNSYRVANDKPLLQQSIENSRPDWSTLYTLEKVTERKNGKLVTSKPVLRLNAEPSATLLSFPLLGNPLKKVYLLLEDGLLDYAFVDGTGDEIELSLRAEDAAAGRTKPSALTYHAAAGRLTFINKGVTYTVIDTPGKLGVEVVQNGKTIFLAGNPRERTGSLSKLKGLKLRNLVVKP